MARPVSTSLLTFGNAEEYPVMHTDLMSLRSAVLGTLSKVSEKSFDRDLLSDGESHSVTATIAGTVDGKKFSFDVDAALTVGHATHRKTVSAPSAESMLAFVLGTVSMKQRDALVSVMFRHERRIAC